MAKGLCNADTTLWAENVIASMRHNKCGKCGQGMTAASLQSPVAHRLNRTVASYAHNMKDNAVANGACRHSMRAVLVAHDILRQTAGHAWQVLQQYANKCLANNNYHACNNETH